MESSGEANRVAPTNSHPVTPVTLLPARLSHQRSAGIDWLTLSVAGDRKAAERIERTHESLLGQWTEARLGYGYKAWEVAGGLGKLGLRPRKAEGMADVLLVLPGRALDWIRDSHVLGDLTEATTDQALCSYFLGEGWRASRIDIAIDMDDPSLNPLVVRDALAMGDCVSKAKMFQDMQSHEIGVATTPGKGMTVMVGGRTSSRFMRCYDKRQEVMQSLHKDIWHLTRFELEIKRDAAQKVFEEIARCGVATIPRVFSGWINFKDPTDTASRKERRRNAAWWARLVGVEEPIKLGLMRGISSPEKVMHWLKHTVAKSLHLADLAGLTGELEEAKKAKEAAVKPEDRHVWAAYRARLEDEAAERGSSHEG